MAEPEVTRDAFPTVMWIGILSVYVLLLGVTGYLAFLVDVPRELGGGGHYNSAHVPIEVLERAAANKETQTFVLETLKADSASYHKKRELASQSFNVVLGALIGFLSASATFAFGKRVMKQGEERGSGA
jgi:hypothetical protein